jgi:hypothetical protein
MDRDIAVALLDQLHAAQNEFYGGGINRAMILTFFTIVLSS